MSLDPDTRAAIDTQLDWLPTFALQKADQDFCRNFRVVEEHADRAVVMHWTKAMVDVQLGAGGAIVGWTIRDP